MDPTRLARELNDFLAVNSQARVVEDGEVLFDLSSAKYSVSGEQGKCLLHLWSAERNSVRRIVDLEQKQGRLRLAAQRFGKGKPTWIEVIAVQDRRQPSEQRQARLQYQRLLGRLLERRFPEWRIESFTSTPDLEHSFSALYARGTLRRGNSTVCVFGVNDSELQAAVDGALTFALLWLDFCRNRDAARSVVEALWLFVPQGRSAVIRARMHHLNRRSTRFELFEFDEKAEEIISLDLSDQGNIATRLVRCSDADRVKERFARADERMRAAVPESDAVVLSSTELAFRLYGLEFARARLATSGGSFAREEEIVFGNGAYETVLIPEAEPLFDDLMQRLRAARRPDGNRNDPLWRMQPERWLESETQKNITALDAQLDPAHVYAQVPAFAASDRGMIDLLASMRDGRLAVLELKADEDIHLPLQGLDYWSRVKWHHEREEFHQFGYFLNRDGSRRPLSSDPPLLLLVAPALHIHPATDTILRYFSAQVEWMLIAVDERWRDEIKVVFRKRRTQAASFL